MTRQPLPLLLALGCCTPISALALGMGQIQVQSALNQIFEAEIPLLVANPGELNGLTARLAPAQVFAQRGIERLALLSDLMFSVQTGSDGRSVIRVTSKQPIREPLLNFLVQLNGRGQQQIREFAVLLDMPVAVTRQRPAMAGSRGRLGAAESVGGHATPTIAHRGTATYGPVLPGETLWNLATRVRPDASISVPRMMEALLQANPRAFWKPNVHGLKAGVTLRIPSAQEVDPVRFSEQRSQQLASQLPPTVAAATTAPKAPAAAPATPRQPRLRLLPPETEAPPAAPGRLPATTAPMLAGPFQIKLKNNRPELQLAGLDEARNRLSGLSAPPTGPIEQPTTVAPPSPSVPPTSPLTAPPPTAVPAPPPVATVVEPPPTRVPPGAEQPPAAEQRPAVEQPPVRLPFQEATPPGMGPAPSATLPAPAANTLPLPVPPPSDSTLSLPTPPPPKPEPLAAVSPPSQLPVAPPATAPVLPPPPAVPAAETGGWLSDIRLWLLGLIAALIGLLAVVWLRWRGQPEATGTAEPLAIDAALPAAALSEETALLSARPKQVREGVRPRPARAVPSPLERADLLIAVGNFEEAEKVIRQARDEQPENATLSAKLLDIHFATRNAAAFIKEAQQLSSLLKDETNSLWLKVAQQGRELCPGHALFGGVSRQPLDTDLIPTHTVLTTPLPPARVPAEVAKEPPSQPPFGSLELELTERTGPVKSTPPAPPPSPPVEKDLTLDTFAQLNWQLSDVEPPTVASMPVQTESPARLTGEDTLATLDWQLPDMEPPTLASNQSAERMAGPVPRQEEPPLDKGFQFDGVAPLAGKVGPPSRPVDTDRPTRAAFGRDSAGKRDDELVELFKQFDITPAEPGSLPPPASTSAPVSADYVETKLDLALAYLDMDDAVGARSLLEEVLQEGNEQQKRRAAEITAKLGNGRAG